MLIIYVIKYILSNIMDKTSNNDNKIGLNIMNNSPHSPTEPTMDIKDLKIGFKKVLTKFISDSERGIYRKVNSKPNNRLRRDAVGSKSFNGYSNISLSSPQSPRVSHSPATPGTPRTPRGLSNAIALEAYQTPEISPRDILQLKRSGRSTRDFNNTLSLVGVQLTRQYNNTESELLNEINEQLNNLRGNSSNVNGVVVPTRKRRASF